jgi:hypothetical protein
MQSIDEFVHSQNVENLRRQLNADLDQDRRRVLLALLAEEEGKLRNSKSNGWRFDQDRFARPRVRQA